MSSAVDMVAPVLSIVKARKPGREDDAAAVAGAWPRVYTTAGTHPFDEIEWKIVDAELLGPDGKVVFRQDGVEVPAWWNQNSVNVVADKYFRVIDGVKERSVKQIYSRVASQICLWAANQNYFNTDSDASVFEEELLYALVHQYGSFNSPVWFNLGVPGRKQTASACFISGVDDSLDDIMSFQRAETEIFKGGSGSGANLSNLRSSYETISAGSYTSGPMSWMQGTDAYAGAMKSGGATRNAAKMVVLDMDHPDVLQRRDGSAGFIRCKAEVEKMAHSLVAAGYSAKFNDPNSVYKSLPYQNANHSVSVPDAFMQAVIDDGGWATKERSGGKPVHSYKAREVWSEIAAAAWMCGDPGVQFTDTINRWHTTPKSGRIRSSNPCSEFLHVDNTACNLCALNLTKFFDGRKFQYERFAQAVRLFSTSQMAIVSKADYPTQKISENSLKLRPIGTNYGDLGALLMKLGYGYDSDEGRAVAARLASLMTGLVYLTAAQIAARVGAFSDFEKNREDMLRVMRMHSDADASILGRWGQDSDPIDADADIGDVAVLASDVWREAISLGEKHGYSVSQATLQAPLGTISFMMGMSTTGIEPAFSLVSYKSMVGGGTMKIVNSGVREALVNLGYPDDAVTSICKYVEDNDTIEGAPDLKPEDLPVFDCALPSGERGVRCVSPMGHLKMMAAIQPLITCAQSKTVNLPGSISEDEIASIYLESWRMGLKCVALYRNGCKASQPLATKKTAEDQGSIVSDKVVEAIARASERTRMPDDVTGWRHKFSIDGYSGYIIVNEYEDGTPGEVFLKLGKPGSTVSGLIDGFTQLLSLSLQYGIPLPKLIGSFIDTRFEPAGLTSHKHIRFTKSLYDYLFKVLDVRYYGGQYSGLSERVEASLAVSEDVHEGITRAKTSSPPSIAAVQPPRTSRNLDSPPCSRCGAITQRNGSCYLCSNCGTTTGCS